MSNLMLKAGLKMQNAQDKLFGLIFNRNEEGMTTLEIVVLISVVLVIATVLFLFRDTITDFIRDAMERIGEFDTVDEFN